MTARPPARRAARCRQENSPGELRRCAAACRRWGECGFTGEERSCRSDCTSHMRERNPGAPELLAACMAKLACPALGQSLAMNMGPAGYCSTGALDVGRRD